MCISVNPVEFNSTVIANFPEHPSREDTRILSYMNTASAVETMAGADIAGPGPNAMIFPIYGEVTHVAECPDPEASKQWLSAQRGVYRELWLDGVGARSLRMAYPADTKIRTAGNYLVGIANGVENIPSTLGQLRRSSPRPEHVPEAPDHILEIMDKFYRTQDLGMPQFAIAAFALAPEQVDKKNPVTVHYTQSSNLLDKAAFPALDYHGQGSAKQFVGRDHRLFIATNELNELFGPAMHKRHPGDHPTEFALAPTQFPLEVRDERLGSDEPSPATAPNNDYIIDMHEIHQRLEGVRDHLSALVGMTDYDLHRAVGAIVTERVGRLGLFGRSNQPATTAEAYADFDDNLGYFDDTLVTDNLF